MYKELFPSHQRVRTVLAFFFVVHAIFLFAMPLLPFIDLPNHLAEATVYKFYGEDGDILSNFYKPTPWYFPNTFHTVFCSLFPNVEFGNKVFHILYIGLLLTSLFLVISQLKGNLWYGLLGLLFVYNFNVTYGFVGFAISIPALILLFYFILHDFEKDTVMLKFAIAGMLIILFWMHAQNALYGLVLFAVMTIIQYRNSFRRILIHGVTIPLPLIALIFAWWFNRGAEKEDSTSGFLANYYTNDYFREFFVRLGLPLFDNFQLYDGLAGVIVAGVFFLMILIPVLWFKPWQRFQRKDLDLSLVYAGLFFLSAFGCYLILPDELPGQSPLFQRLCTIVLLSLIILISVFLKGYETKSLSMFAIVCVSIYSLFWFEYIFTFNQENKGFNPNFFSKTETPSRIAGLIYDQTYRGRKVYVHYPNYFLVWKHGIASTKMIDYRFGVVRRVADESIVPFYDEHVGDKYKVVSNYQHLEYLLVRGRPPVKEDFNLKNFTAVESAGDWILYDNKNADGPFVHLTKKVK